MESKYVGKSKSLSSVELSSELGRTALQSQSLIRVDAGQVRELRWNSAESAYLVKEGYRVSTPSCVLCGHQFGGKCECISCIELKNIRAVEAAELLQKEVASLEPIDIDSLSCSGMLQLFKQLSEFMGDLALTDRLSSLECLGFEEKATLMLLGLATPCAESMLSAIKMVSINEYGVGWNQIEFTVESNEDLIQFFTRLKLTALNQVRSELGAINVLEVWESLALKEAIGVLEYYCDIHNICCTPGENTTAAIKRSLSRYGLAQTSRYIYNAVRNARTYSSENGFNRYRAFTFIYRNLNFWIEDPRARSYNAPPFNRSENVLCESEDVAIFSRFFLEPNNIFYFTESISTIIG
jgi:hypothetical protein